MADDGAQPLNETSLAPKGGHAYFIRLSGTNYYMAKSTTEEGSVEQRQIVLKEMSEQDKRLFAWTLTPTDTQDQFQILNAYNNKALGNPQGDRKLFTQGLNENVSCPFTFTAKDNGYTIKRSNSNNPLIGEYDSPDYGNKVGNSADTNGSTWILEEYTGEGFPFVDTPDATKAFTIVSARGGMYGTDTEVKASETATAANTFAFIPYELHGTTQHFLYNIEKKKFVIHTAGEYPGNIDNSNNQLKLSDDNFSVIASVQVNPISTIALTDNYRASITSHNYKLNINSAGNVVINTWQTADPGNKLAIIAATDFSETNLAEATTMLNNYYNKAGVTATPDASKTYMITSKRGMLYADDNAELHARNRTETLPGRFVFVPYTTEDGEKHTFLYNVDKQKFVVTSTSSYSNAGVESDLLDKIADVAVSASSAPNGKYVANITSGNNMFNINSSNNLEINSWKTQDDGNKLAIIAISDFSEEAMKIATDKLDRYFNSPKYTATYTLTFNGRELKRQVVANIPEGSAVPASSVITGLPNYIRTISDHAQLETITSDVTINYTAVLNTGTDKLVISSDIADANATKVAMKNRNNNKWVFGISGQTTTVGDAATAPTAETKDNYLWIITGDWNAGYNIYNVGQKKYLTADDQTQLSETPGVFDLSKQTNGWAFKVKGTGKVLGDHKGQNGTLGLWSDGSLADGGSVHVMYVEDDLDELLFGAEYVTFKHKMAAAKSLLENDQIGTGVHKYTVTAPATGTKEALQEMYDTYNTAEWTSGNKTPEEYTAAANSMAWTLNTPEKDKVYLLKSVAYPTKYVNGQSTLADMAEGYANEKSFMLRYTNDGKLQSVTDGTDVALNGNLNTFEMTEHHSSTGNYRIVGGGTHLMYAQENGTLDRSSINSEHETVNNTAWMLEPVESLSVTFNKATENEEVYLATFYNDRKTCLPEGVKARYIPVQAATEVENGIYALTYQDIEGDVLPAGTAVLLVSTTGSEKTMFESRMDATDAVESNVFTGTTQTGQPATGLFALGRPAGATEAGFYPYSGDDMVPYRAYLNFDQVKASISNAAEITGFILVDGPYIPTDIDKTICDETEDDGIYYDLSGKRVINPTKAGIYIKNHKKVIIK